MEGAGEGGTFQVEGDLTGECHSSLLTEGLWALRGDGVQKGPWTHFLLVQREKGEA